MECWRMVKRYFIARKILYGYKPLALALFATLSLLSSYVAEYKFHIIPCQLCWYQRYILIALVGGGLLSSIWGIFYPLTRLILWGSFALNTYQIGVEQKWWQPPASCARQVNAHSDTHEDRLKAVYEAVHGNAMPPCDEISWRIYKIPATVWFEGALAFALLWTRR